MTNETPVPPELSPEFAMRVLEEADRVLAHRQRVWRIVASGAAGLSLVLVTALGVRAVDRFSPALHARAVVAVADTQPLATDTGSQADALDDLFPDAAPVERFDRAYLSGNAAAADLLAEDTADDDGNL